MKTSKKEIKNTEDKFSKEQLVKSKRFRNNVDLLNAVLKESKQYTLKEVEEIIKNFMKGKV